MRAPVSFPSLRLPRIAVLALLAAPFFALLVGVLVARSPAMGVSLGALALFGPIALIDLPLALAAFTATLFLRLVPGVGLASNLVALLVLAAWAGGAAGRGRAIRDALGVARPVLVALVPLMLWLALTLAWASDPERVMDDLPYWVLAAVLLVVAATALNDERGVRFVAWAFVVAAVSSVIYGIVSGDLTRDTTAIATSEGDARFGGVGDPNELAAGLVPGVALAVGLVPGMRRGPHRVVVVGAVVLLLLGLAATQSRGGLVAAGICVLATLVVAQGRRFAALAITLGVLTVGAFAVATTPGALDRITSADRGGSGRADLWRVATRIFADHPTNGVGLNHFRVESPDYVRRPGNLESVELIAENPRLVHNTYLQLLVEAGVVGLALFLALIVVCVGSALRAARAFQRAGERALAALAQGTVVAQVGMLSAMFFLSIGTDLRVWLLLALGPALATVAAGRRPDRGLRTAG